MLSSVVSMLALVGSLNLVSPILPENRLLLAQRQMSLENRQPDKYVNQIFKDNILLSMAYMQGNVVSAKDINWAEIDRPFTYKLELRPNETFAFHQDILDQYKNRVILTSRARFGAQDGFKTDGYLYGDGVCHLASLIGWVARDAKLEVDAPTRHDFAVIADVPKEYGVSIYNNPNSKQSSARQNLYITNNTGKLISFIFEYKENNLKLSVVEVN